MKKILGLDLGTNSIGWALTEIDFEKKEGKIIKAGSRIIPMDQALMGDFEKGNKVSQTAERTRFRSVRRLFERHHLRRERLNRVLNIMGFLPEQYASQIDFEKKLGKFKEETEPKIAYKTNPITGKEEFLYQKSFNEMLKDFSKFQPTLLENDKKVPYDWTIYYLRKKALTEKIEKEELAWLLLHFNQKRGYYQLRGEEEEENASKHVEFHSLKVIDVIDSGDKKGKDEIWYNVVLENGWIYRRTSKTKLDWIGKIKEFIVTTDLDENGNTKKDKEGKEKRSFRAPSEDDWTLLKKKTEFEIDKSNKTVGSFIYDTLLANPNQKIKGKLVRTIERKFYKSELKTILEKQSEFHSELKDSELLFKCINELYKVNEAHRNNLETKDFVHFFLNDIIFYQRPLKSQKSLISNCPYEIRKYKTKDGKEAQESIKCIAKSNPLFQEFRLWQFVQNLKIYQKEKLIDGKIMTDVNVTNEFVKTEDDFVKLFDWLNDRKDIEQKIFLKYFGLKEEKYRWNYVEKPYPCNETRNAILAKLSKAELAKEILTTDFEFALWHILYSVEDKYEIEKALSTFATKNGLAETFIDAFKKFAPFKKEYGSYSEKAIKKLLPLLRIGKYWNENKIDKQTIERIDKIINGEVDEKISMRTREKSIEFTNIQSFKGLPLWLACYIVYNRHSESSDIIKWNKPQEIELFLRNDFKQHSLRNPIVEQVIKETLRVVKDIWQELGEGKENFFDEIHIELGREMKNPADKRKQMTANNTNNENTNLRIKSLLMEMMNDKEVENVRPHSPNQQEILKIYEDGVLNSESDIPEDIEKISKQSQPSKNELVKYKLWLEQKYRSPYTGEIIPLNKLFTPAFEIEHIIPQSRYFDDSFSNKIICESAVNKDKDNATAYEYISKEHGKKIEVGFGKEVTVFSIEAYEKFVKKHYGNSRGKMKKLLMDDIPDGFIERQLNDTRYISKVVKTLLSNIVRIDGEEEATSKNVISSNGAITSILKQDWGLNDIWNAIITPRFERLNEITKTNNFGEWRNIDGNKYFQTQVPIEIQKGFNKKRIDHRHHALDAIVIACATRNHINYLNNEYAKAKTQSTKHELKNILCFKQKTDQNGNYKWAFHKPWNNFTENAKEVLETTLISFKQNLRVINKTVNHYQKFKENSDGVMKKITEKQTKGDNWAIRKPMHKETVSGKVSLRFQKSVMLSFAIDNHQMIIDKSLKNQIITLKKQGFDKAKLLKFFKEVENKWNEKDISKTDIYYFENELAASRTKIDDTFTSKTIESVTDSGIRKILTKHLENMGSPELAFSPDGLDIMNKNIVELNNGKNHKPIFSVRTFETIGNKFIVGHNSNKKTKYVEAAKGTNLFFAIYKNAEGKRNYETIPLNIVIELQKQGLPPVPQKNKNGDDLMFYLSPNDLVYVPTEDENINPNLVDLKNIISEKALNVYKFVSCTGNEGHFVPNYYSSEIIKNEMGTNNKSQNTIGNSIQIKLKCWKLTINKIGQITKVIR